MRRPGALACIRLPELGCAPRPCPLKAALAELIGGLTEGYVIDSNQYAGGGQMLPVAYPILYPPPRKSVPACV